jgi:D-alanine-D-alanine ligase
MDCLSPMSPRRVTILYNEPLDPHDPAERDVVVQRDFVAEALRASGHTVETLKATLNLEGVHRTLTQSRPDVVFNLVEALAGTDRLMPLATVLLDSLSLPYTGCDTRSILHTSNKLQAKQTLDRAKLPTPLWFSADVSMSDLLAIDGVGLGAWDDPARWIIKPIWEHASLGMTDAAVVSPPSAKEVLRYVTQQSGETGRPHFAEQYIAGREFNLSLLANPGRAPTVLPPAEIDFSAFPPDKPRIVGQAAKWDVDSFEYQQTPRTFDFAEDDQPLLAELSRLAIECWRLFELRGYARVDFRVDADGQAWILEINANPCLSPDAGFAAALEQSGMTSHQAITRILEDTVPAR